MWHHGVGTVAGALVGAALPAVLGLAARVRRRSFVGCLVAAASFAPWLAVRDSHWVLPLDILTMFVLVLAAAADATVAPGFVALFGRLVRGAAAAVIGPVRLFADAQGALPSSQRPRFRRGVVALVRALPVLVLVGMLLASGDALLASWLQLPGTVDQWLANAFVVAGGACALAGVLHVARRHLPAVADAAPRPWTARSTETIAVLAGALVLESLFVVAQAVAALAGDAYVQRRTGLTYAEYARRGFFQLLAVAGIVGVIVLSVRHVADAAGDRRVRRTVRALAVALVAITVALVAVAVRRLHLYEEVYGLTMLRLYSTVFALWLGAVLVVAGVACVRGGRRPWLVPAVAGSAFVGVFAMNVVNPEAVVVRHDVALAARGGRFDPVYLAMLSDDATPALVHGTRTAPPAIARALRRQLCAPGFRRHDARPGLAANLADHRSQRLNDELCDGAGG